MYINCLFINQIQETIITVGEEKGSTRIKKGLLQGCGLSPHIFYVFIESAIRTIHEKTNEGVNFYGYYIEMWCWR
jgi:hypothetical protein